MKIILAFMVGLLLTSGCWRTGHENMVATSHPLAAEAARRAMKAGGNAIDGAIAANAVLGVVEPMHAGIGGDLFALVWIHKEKKLYAINGSGRSPFALTLEKLKGMGLTSMPSIGPLSLSVPGTVDAWYALNARFGKLKMSSLLAPAIAIADGGFALDRVRASLWKRGFENFKRWPDFVQLYASHGEPPRVGGLFKNPGLAKALQKLAENGRDVFYKGELADNLASSVKAAGGHLGKRDLEEHTSQWVEPIAIDYKGFQVHTVPPNSQGIVLLQMLNALKHISPSERKEELSAFVAAKRAAYEDRARYVSDPEFKKTPSHLLSEKRALEIVNFINSSASGNGDSSDVFVEEGDTVVVVTKDSEGNMVGLIQSLFQPFGSGVVVKKDGYVLQNRGGSFSFFNDHPNVFKPGKRPFHTLMPVFVTTQQSPVLMIGSIGGDGQPQFVGQVLMSILDKNMKLQEAIDSPRLRHIGSSTPNGIVQSGRGEIWLEKGYEKEIINFFGHRQYRIKVRKRGFGSVQGIGIDKTGQLQGGSDSRVGGRLLSF